MESPWKGHGKDMERTWKIQLIIEDIEIRIRSIMIILEIKEK